MIDSDPAVALGSIIIYGYAALHVWALLWAIFGSPESITGKGLKRHSEISKRREKQVEQRSQDLDRMGYRYATRYTPADPSVPRDFRGLPIR